MKNRLIIVFLSCLFFIISVFTFVNINIQTEKNKTLMKEITKTKKNEIKVQNIKSHYNKYVKTNKKTQLYDENYKIIGEIDSGFELTLDDVQINEKTKYFFSNNLKYFINYNDVSPVTKLTDINKRYQKYIVFNENIITKDITNFYNSDNLVLTINHSFDLPVIIKDTDIYYVEFNNELYHINKTDVEKVVKNNNTSLVPRSNIAVLAYHFVYDPKVEECTSVVCLTESKFDSQIKYLSDNNYFTLTMKEMELFLDGKIRIPKNSVTLTIDDGWLVPRSIAVLEKYKLNATLFLITSIYKPEWFQSEYLELHSHGDNLHNTGVCPGGQGGGIKCLPKDKILDDLKKSRDILSNPTAFCYPFYEFNDYAISLVKEAGFTLGFIGGYSKAGITSNKLLIPRLTIMYDDTLEEVISLIQ